MRTNCAVGILAVLHACTGSAGLADANSDARDVHFVADAHDALDVHDARLSDASRLDAMRDAAVDRVAIDDAGFDSFEIADGGPPEIPANGPLFVASLGGPVLGNAHLVTVDWSDFPYDTEMRQMADALPASRWLDTVGSEYGVAVSGHTHFTLEGPTPSSLTETDLVRIVEEGIASSRWPAHPGAPDAEPIWMFFATSSATTDWFAAHDSRIGTSGVHVIAYDRVIGPLGEFQQLFSHEVIEALTDPYPDAMPALRVGPNDVLRGVNGGSGSEVADLCPGTVDEGGFTYTRSWSNRASLAGLPPCQPVPSGDWFALQGPSGAVRADRGSTVVIPIDAIGSTPGVRFAVSVTLGAGGPLSPYLDRASATAGDTLNLTVTLPTDSSGPWWVRIDSGPTVVDTQAFCPVEIVAR